MSARTGRVRLFFSGGFCLVVVSVLWWPHSREQENDAPSHPVADFPAQIELGSREIGEVALAQFFVANRGGADLFLDEFQSNCSCSGLERRSGIEYVRLQSLRIKPGEEVELFMRVSVRGVPVGSRVTNGVSFRTNDPTRLAGRIEAVISRVTGGVMTFPECVAFGSAAIGADVRALLDVRDEALALRAVDRATSSHERIRVTVLPAPAGDAPTAVKPGKSIAQIEVVVDTATPGSVEGLVTIHLAGGAQPPAEVRVFGRVHAPLEVSPPTLVLPRTSSTGPVFEAKCVVRSHVGDIEQVDVVSLPDYIQATIDSDRAGPNRGVRVALDPNKIATVPRGSVAPILLCCSAGGRKHDFALKILVNP